MGKRKHNDRSEGALNLAGDLASRLVDHAHRRMTHFFLFQFAVSALCKRADDLDGGTTDPSKVIKVIATHQIDTGFKSKKVEHRPFDKKSVGLGQQISSDFAQMDAAHFCNLGFDPTRSFSLYLRINSPKADPTGNDLYERVKIYAGDTQLLPKRINIGPDRIVDQLHGVLAKRFLGAARAAVGPGGALVPVAVVTPAYIATYLGEALTAMSDYRDMLEAQGDDGLIECVDCYIQVYNPIGPALRNASVNETAFAFLRGAIEGDCAASKGALDARHYVGT